MEAVLAWQAVVFLSIAFSGKLRGTVVVFWIVWTFLQVFAFWLSVVQFLTIFIAWKIFHNKGASTEALSIAPTSSNQAHKRNEPQSKLLDPFEIAIAHWKKQLTEISLSNRWIPKGEVKRFLSAHPAPNHFEKTWKLVVGDNSPEATVLKFINENNKKHIIRQRHECKEFFDTVEKNPLTREQELACICMDEAVMVVAAAGSGKTSTIVAKVGYALKEKLATPDQILLLAFNRTTADEVGERILEQLHDVHNVGKVRSRTFHAFGIDVIANATGRKPSLAPWVDPDKPGEDIREIGEIIQSLSSSDPDFKREWDFFRIIYGRDIGKWGQRQEPDSYIDGKRGFLTANGEIVKSKEERLIADWLFYNDVSYVYERAYEHETANTEFRQYFPDFYFPDAQLYHEHFALNEKGEPPKDFKGYLEGVKWKREIHANYGTALVETTSHELTTGKALEALTRALIVRGIQPIFNPSRQSVGLAPIPEKELSRSFRIFQQHVKNNGLTHSQLSAALQVQADAGFGPRLRMYLNLYEKISTEWERRLKSGGFIDFEDMLIQASELVESGAYKCYYTMILADEFQDSSRARIRLLKALSTQPKSQTHLCVVGDDWQGINRFAGSDISVMKDFEKTFENATRLSLNITFRCPKYLCEVSSQFIQLNPSQIKKDIRTTNPLTKTPMLAFGFQSVDSITGFVEQQLAEMYRYAKDGKLLPLKGELITCMLLGRYRDDCPAALDDWQRRFKTHLKIDFRTVHGAKGLEAEYLFVLNVVQGMRGFPSQIQDDPALQMAMPTPESYPYAEERRLFYVAMTRSRKQVRFYTALNQPSQFLVELVKKGQLVIVPVDGQSLEACPQCGNGVLQARTGKFGDFYSCSRFPKCDFTKSNAQKALQNH